MGQDRQRLSEIEADRIYSRRIRPDFLDDVGRSSQPTAVLVGGQPGAAKSYVTAQVRAHLATTVGPSVVVSGDELRQYHPHWRARGHLDSQVTPDTQADVGRWYARLTIDAIANGVNLVFVTSMRQPQAALALATRLKSTGYEVAAVVLASDRDQSRQATLTLYDLGRSAGDAPRFVPAAYHDDAYDRLRESLARIEAERTVDRVQLVARDGRQLYANQSDGERWLREPKATYVLDDFRERRLTARELADSALRWRTLVQRLASDPTVPREVASQAITWRNEATAKAEGDPEAKQLLAWGQEAESFKTMNRHQFLREFPQHAKAVERLEEAISYAEKTFEDTANRERFIAQARDRLAERIAEGRYAAPHRPQTKERGSKAR
jgi:hypothetical protein